MPLINTTVRELLGPRRDDSWKVNRAWGCREASSILAVSVVVNEQSDQNILQMFVFKGGQSGEVDDTLACSLKSTCLHQFNSNVRAGYVTRLGSVPQGQHLLQYL